MVIFKRFLSFLLAFLMIFSTVQLFGCNPEVDDSAHHSCGASEVLSSSNNLIHMGTSSASNTQNSQSECAEHVWGEWKLSQRPTKDAPGIECRSCSLCSAYETRELTYTLITSGNFGPVKNGEPSDSVTYSLYNDGTMYIEGKGDLFSCDWNGTTQPFIDYREDIIHLVIGEGITATRGGGFAHLTNLETLSLPSTMKKLQQNAFMSSFKDTITKITIPLTVTHIGSYALGHYNGNASAQFTDITIENPNTVFTDHPAVFNGGKGLEYLTLYSYGSDNNVSAYAKKYGINYIDMDKYIYGSTDEISYKLYNGVLTLNALKENAKITSNDAPWNEYKDTIRKIEINNGITEIGDAAFENYPILDSVELSASVKRIGDKAFSASDSRSVPLSIKIPKRVESIGNDIFSGRKKVHLTAYYGSEGAKIAEPCVELTIKKQYKFLMIGNSYTDDASNRNMPDSQLFNILQAMLGEDAEVLLGVIMSGGKGINWHATQANTEKKNYSFSIISSENNKWQSMGSTSAAEALAWTDWDAVSLQHYGLNTTTGCESVPYPQYTDEKYYPLEVASEFMLDHISKNAPYAEIYFYMHWAQTKSTTLNAVLSNYNKMANYIPVVLDYAGEETGAKFKTIVPVGTSVQNARTTYLALLRYNTTAYDDGNLNLNTDAQIGLQRDGGHLSYNIGRYIAALTFAEMIIPQEMRAQGYVLPDIRKTESVGVLPKQYTEIAQKAVFAAVDGWKNGSLKVTEIEGYLEDPTVEAQKLISGKTITIGCSKDEEVIKSEIIKAVKDILGEDFAVDNIIFSGTDLCEITIRFGYTSVTVSVGLYQRSHSYTAKNVLPCKEEEGHTDYTCSVCSDTYTTKWLDPSAYNGMKIACIGDSITAGVGVTPNETDYVTLLADELGMDYIRLGASGTVLCTGGHRACNIGKLTEANLKGADVVTILMGINDFDQAKTDYYTLGNIDSTDTSTIYGALKMWCERIESLRKTETLQKTQFYFITPVITSWNHSISSAKSWDQSKTNICGYTLRDLCNAIIEVASLYEIPVIDLNLKSGIYYISDKDNTAFDAGGDGVHPNEVGHKMMAEALKDALLQNYNRDDHEHEFGSWITTDYPSCTAGTESRVCRICSATETKTLSANKNHDYTAQVTPPTCTEKGYTTHTCECGDSYIDSYVPENGHSYGAWEQVKAPSCSTKGQDRSTCTSCGEERYRNTRASGSDEYILVSNPLPKDYFADKTIMCIGDSITAGTGVTSGERYSGVLGRLLGANVINRGTSGAVLSPGGHLPNRFDTLMTEEVMKNVDIVTILLGVNDWNNGVKDGYFAGKLKYDPSDTYYDLGEFGTDDTSTIYGAAKMWCERIIELQATESCADTQFIFMTPVILARNSAISPSIRDWDQSKTNAFGHTLREYCEAIMEVCAHYGIPCLDLNLYSGMYYRSETDCEIGQTTDGIHPGVSGHALMAEAISEFLIDNYSYEKRSLENLGHTYVESITPPTHTSGGYTEHTCTICGNSYRDSFTDPIPYLKGDINGDDKVNNRDAARLMQYLAGWDVEYIESVLDVNGDGRINNRDAARLMQYLAGWDVEIH